MSATNVIGTLEGATITTPTTAGAAYVNKVTHPPSPMTGEYRGRPDCSQPNVVLMELKSEVNIPPILTFPTSATAVKTVNPSSVLLLQSSGALVSNYIFHYLSDSATTASGWVQPVGQPAVSGSQPAVSQVCSGCTNFSGYNFGNWASDVGSFRQTYKSSTYYLNATEFNDQGTVTTAKFKPDIIQGTNLTTYLLSLTGDSQRNLADAIRVSIANNNVSRREGEKIRFTDGYEIIDPTAPSGAIPYQFVDFTNPAGSGGTLPFSTTLSWNTVLPLNASQLLTSSPKAATRPAKDGAFVVLQQEDEVMPWISVYNSSGASVVVPTGLLLSFMRFSVGSTLGYVPLFSTNPTSTTSFTPFTGEVQWGSLDWSITIFEGLTVPTTVGTVLSSVPYITSKAFVGLEIQPKIGSSLVTFQRSLPLPDPDAIKMAVGIMHARPDSLPASANDLASIASTALKFIPSAVTWLKDLFGAPRQKAKAMKQARDFVKPKTDNRPRQQNSNRLEKQIANLTNQVSRLATQQRPTITPLPTFQSQPGGKPQRKRSRRRRNNNNRRQPALSSMKAITY